MRTSKFSEEQIIGLLRRVEAGMPVKEIGCKHGFSDASFCKWRSKFAGMDVSEAKRLRELELENGKLNRLLAAAHLDIPALKSVFGPQSASPTRQTGGQARVPHLHSRRPVDQEAQEDQAHMRAGAAGGCIGGEPDWSMDIVSDAIARDGALSRRIKCLTVADDFSHECLDITADFGIGGAYVTRLLDRAATFRG